MDLRLRISLKSLAVIALVAVTANLMVATTASHAHASVGNFATGASAAPEPSPRDGNSDAHEPSHCEGCCSRADAEQRITGSVRANGSALLTPATRLWSAPLLALREQRIAGSLPARGPPAVF